MNNEYCLLITFLTSDKTLLRIILKLNDDILSIEDAHCYKELDVQEKLNKLIPEYLKVGEIVEVESTFIFDVVDLTKPKE